MRELKYVVVVASCSVLAACGSLGKELGADAAGKVADSLKASSVHLKEGLDSVGAGLSEIKNIDPVALKQLLAKDQELENRLRDLQGQLISYGPKAGVVNVTSTNRVFFEITGFKGTLRLDAWVDDEQNWFIRNSVLQGVPVSLDVTYDASLNEVESVAVSTWRATTGKPMDGHLWVCDVENSQGHDLPKLKDAACRFAHQMETTRRNVDAEYKKRVATAFDRFLKSPFTLPSGNLRGAQAIDQRFRLKSGEHVVYLRVTPEQPEDGNKWALEYRSYATGTSGAQLQIATGRLDSDTSEWALGRPLSPVEASRFYVDVAK